jgi:toxin ParE1/3/4
MRVRYTPRAFADREAIFAYLDRRNPRAARDVKAFIKGRILELSQFPKRHHFIKEFDAHALWLGRYPYIVYYRIRNEEVIVIHIRHAAQRPWQGE